MDQAVESAIRAALVERLGEARYGLWFGEGVRLALVGDELEVIVPNEFFRDWIDRNYADDLRAAGGAVAGRPLELSVLVDAGQAAGGGPGETAPPQAGEGRRREPGAGAGGESQAQSPLVQPRHVELEHRPRRSPRRLDDFVVGSSNQLAHAAVLEIVQSMGSSFNPLLIHGGIGLGKSHLLEGAAQAMKERKPGIHILHVTAESFTNAFLDAMRTGALPGFRARFRKAEALLVDDVHFLAAKRATQDEFLHTFNTLIAQGAPMILAVDQHPRLMHKLPDELITRFLGGMVVKVEAPDLETRKRILEAKARARGIEVPEAVTTYVAEHLKGSVRELEGALNSLIAHSVLANRKVDLNLARTALRDTIRHTARALGLRDVERVVCELFGIEPEVLRSESRSRAAAYPRMIAMHLARKHTGAAYMEIGRYFGGRNHSTVIAAEKKVEAWIRDEERTGLLAGFESIADLLAALEHRLQG